MRILLLLIAVMAVSASVSAQKERDSVMRRCPIFITDTVSSNNFFLEAQPCTLRVIREGGDLTIQVQQRDQFFTIFFKDKKLKNTKYKIKPNGVQAKYSFRAGEQVSYVNVGSGIIESTYDKEKKMWHLKLNGMIANLVERSVTYYRARADLWFP
jgi:hypothetical protein